jgi:hypothetical protein
MLRRILPPVFLLAFLALTAPVQAQIAEDEECAACHDDRTLTAERNGRTVSLWVNFKAYAQSVHAREGCVSCHQDVDPDDLPHEDRLEKVDCSMCHDDAVMKFNRSLHGSALDEGRFLAPTCSTCHGKHDILPSKNEKAPTYVTNIPALCGQCHKEGTRVNELRAVSQRHVLEDYIESIHGDGLFRRGLIVTAVCTSCHTAHDILPHENRESSISRANIAMTCQQCHRQIEQVHTKVIDGRLWEQAPNQIPICVDCHQPHQVRRVAYTGSYPDTRCMSCHSDRNLKRTLHAQGAVVHQLPYPGCGSQEPGLPGLGTRGVRIVPCRAGCRFPDLDARAEARRGEHRSAAVHDLSRRPQDPGSYRSRIAGLRAKPARALRRLP